MKRQYSAVHFGLFVGLFVSLFVYLKYQSVLWLGETATSPKSEACQRMLVYQFFHNHQKTERQSAQQSVFPTHVKMNFFGMSQRVSNFFGEDNNLLLTCWLSPLCSSSTFFKSLRAIFLSSEISRRAVSVSATFSQILAVILDMDE